MRSQLYGTAFPVWARVSGSVLVLTANTLGLAANGWAVATSCQSNYAQYGIGCSFGASLSNGTLTGAQ